MGLTKVKSGCAVLMVWAFILSAARAELSKREMYPPLSSSAVADNSGKPRPKSLPPGVEIISNENGQFTLKRTDGKWLLYPNEETSYLSVNVDGNVYTNDEGGGLNVASHSGTTWTYQPVGGVQITQVLTIDGDALRCFIEAAHITGPNHSVQARYLFDTQVDDNDGAPLYAAGTHYTREAEFVPPAFTEWRSWRRPDDQSVIGVGGLHPATTTKVVFAHWPKAVHENWSYTADPAQIFYTAGYTGSPQSDSCVLVYMNLGTLTPGTCTWSETYYGTATVSTNPSLTSLLYEIRNLRSELLQRIRNDKNNLAVILAYAYKAAYEDPAMKNDLSAFFSTGSVSVNVARLVLGQTTAAAGFFSTGLGLFMSRYLESLDEETRAAFDAFWNELLYSSNFSPDDDVNTLAAKIGTLLASDSAVPFSERESQVQETLADLEAYVAGYSPGVDLTEEIILQTLTNIQRATNDLRQSNAHTFLIKWYDPGAKTFAYTEMGGVSEFADIVQQAYENMHQASAGLGKIALWLKGSAFVAGGAKLVIVIGHLVGAELVSVPAELAIGGTALIAGAGAVETEIAGQALDVAMSRNIAVLAIQNCESARKTLYSCTRMADDAQTYVTEVLQNPALYPASQVAITDVAFVDVVIAEDLTVGQTADGRVSFSTSGIPAAKTGIFVDVSASTAGSRKTILVSNMDPVNVTPGAYTKSFSYEAIDPASIGSTCATYTGKVWVSYGTALACSNSRAFTVGTRGACAAARSNVYTVAASGAVEAGSTHTSTFEVPDDMERFELVLDYPGSDLDLHLYDPQMNHVGIDYDTGDPQTEIPGSTYSGSNARPEVLVIENPTGGSYTLKIVGVTVESGPEPFEVSALLEPARRIVSITKCTVKSGTTRKGEPARGLPGFIGRDSISFNGTVDIAEEDLENAADLRIALISDADGQTVYDQSFPLDSYKVSGTRYSYADRGRGISASVDMRTGKAALQLKNVDLTGLACPLILEVRIGDYEGAGAADEVIVNAKRPIPMQLMNGYANSLRVDKITARQGKKFSTDTLSVSGALALKDAPGEVASAVLSLGDQSFAMTDADGKFTCKKDKTANITSVSYTTDRGIVPQVKARFDFVKCTYSVTVRNADLATTSGQTDLALFIDMALTASDYNESVPVELK